MIVVSVASGTSVDGIDLAAFELVLEHDTLMVSQLSADVVPWPDDLAQRALAVLPPATTTIAEVCRLDNDLGRGFARAVRTFAAGLDRPAEAVVCSGQTVYHDVQGAACLGTLQLGQPAWIEEATGLPVVSDLRSTDVAAGGHGAPLAGVLDRLWLAPEQEGRRRGALNLGGIANLSVLTHDAVRAWDTGPANCLIDVAAARATDGAWTFDRDGEIASAGSVDAGLLGLMLEHPYFAQPPPKSTGREVFTAAWLDECCRATDVTDARDVVATTTELTARTVADAVTDAELDELVVAGGGARNPVLMARIEALAGCPVTTTQAYGIGVDDKESLLWALLGWLRLHSAPVPDGATSAPRGRVLGRVSCPAGIRLPEPTATPRRLVTR